MHERGPAKRGGRAGLIGLLLLPLLLALCPGTHCAAHDPLVIAGTLTADDDQVSLTLDVKQWALLAVLGRQDTLFPTTAAAVAAGPQLGRYLVEHVELSYAAADSADVSTVTLVSAGPETAAPSELPDPLRFVLTGTLPKGAGRLRLTLNAFAELGSSAAVIDSIAFSGPRVVAAQMQAVKSGEPLTCDLAVSGVGSASSSVESPTHPGDTVAGAKPGALAQAWSFMRLGFLHILPEGLDHILFVLGLFLLAPRLKPLLTQVTAFTLAHSLTLGLAMAGLIAAPPRVVEPLIALSIAVVAIENLYARKVHAWRWLTVFAFGLVHGLGFAGALRQMPLEPGRIFLPLISFNLGVEGGQLAVIALAAGATCWCWQRPWYATRVVRPASMLIAAIGLFWAVQRGLGFGIEP